MGEESKPVVWWQTAPGLLTASAAIITAISGLILAVHQAGLLGQSGSAAAPAKEEAAAISPKRAKGAPAGESTEATIRTPASTPGVAAADVARPRSLPTPERVRIGEDEYEFLGVTLARYGTDQLALKLRVRMWNNGGYGKNFWSDSFRLLIDGVPRAPANLLNEVVKGHSAEEGDVEFHLPEGAHSVALVIHGGRDEKATVPIDIVAPS